MLMKSLFLLWASVACLLMPATVSTESSGVDMSLACLQGSPADQAQCQRAALVDLYSKMESLKSQVDESEKSHNASCRFDCSHIADYVCPPLSETCNYFNNATIGNYCVNITVDYTVAPYFQMAAILDRQRDRSLERGTPPTLSNIPTGYSQEPVQTPWALGNKLPNNLPPYHAVGALGQLAGQNYAFWNSLSDSRTGQCGGNGIWVGLVKSIAWNDSLLHNCDAITKTFPTANKTACVVGEYNAPGCPICVQSDQTCSNVNDYKGPGQNYGTLDYFIRSPPFDPSVPRYWDEQSGIMASTGVFAKWKCTGSVHLHTQSDSSSYKYELCPSATATRTVPPPYNN